MKRSARLISVLLALMLCLSALSVTALAADAGWVKNDGVWYYRLENGSYKTGWLQSGEKWYYFDSTGAMLADGLCDIGGKYYYFNASGAMFTGWKQLSVTLDDGTPYSFWVYFTSSGAMVENGWQKINDKWYYFVGGEMLANDLYEIDGKIYYLNASGAMVTGWKKLTVTLDDGTFDSYWAYFQSSGVMVENGWQKISEKWYYFADGEMRTGWYNSDPTYLTEGGTNGYWYYLDPTTGAMATGWKKVPFAMQDGSTYTTWAYFQSNGVQVESSWLKIDGKWYYFDENGEMLTNTWVGSYYVGSDGAMV